MSFIITLIILGILFMVAEIILLPGLTIAGILSLACYGSAIYLAFTDYGVTCGVIVIVVIAVLSIVGIVLSLRSKTWQRLSLNQKLESTASEFPEKEIAVGDKGTTLSRLAPMGKVEINGKIYEAKSFDIFIDPKESIEVVSFENFSVIVRLQSK